VAAEIKKAVGIDADVVEGSRGEFTIWVDNQRVAEKTADGFPSDQDALMAVRRAVGKSG